MAITEKVKEALKTLCHELNTLPSGWTFNVGEDMRIEYHNTNNSDPPTYSHPTFGGLPDPWQLKLVKPKAGAGSQPMYYNPITKKRTLENPRDMKSTLAQRSGNLPPHLWIASSAMKNNGEYDSSEYKRTPINYMQSLRDAYYIVYAIDDGEGAIGAMNGGVFVVALKGSSGRVYIEKRVKPGEMAMGKKEIEMLHRVNHSALCSFIAAFILEDAKPPSASLYMEFCDRGSLEGLIKKYSAKRSKGDRSIIPEGFVWHALMGLADGLAYLQSGVSTWNKGARADPRWIPILHRDIKPDNVMLKSRSSLGSKKYFYCILSDFGLACDDRADNDPRADPYQVARLKLGTGIYYAPELLHDPYPRPGPGPDPKMYFPPGQRHTKYSDMWAVGACAYNLCSISNGASNAMTHVIKHQRGSPDTHYEGTISRVRNLTIPNQYTPQLRMAILKATEWDVTQRPSPRTFMERITPVCEEAGYLKQGSDFEQLPDWATTVHDFHAQAEKIRSEKGYK